MSNDSNGCFWTFLFVFVASLLGHHNGREYQRKIDREQRRDDEIEQLKNQINEMKAKRY